MIEMKRLTPYEKSHCIGHRHGALPRVKTTGVSTIVVLVALVLLASLALTLKARTGGDSRILARLNKELEDRIAQDSILDELRAPLLVTMTGISDAGIAFDGSPMVFKHIGRDWEVRVQDVEGLVDLYLAPQEQLDLLPVDAPTIIAVRDMMRSELPPNARFPVLPMSAAQFGLDYTQLKGLVTQSGTTGMLRLRSLPDPLKEAKVFPGPRENEQITRVTVDIRPLATSEAP